MHRNKKNNKVIILNKKYVNNLWITNGLQKNLEKKQTRILKAAYLLMPTKHGLKHTILTVGITNDIFIVEAPNQFAYDWIINNYQDIILSSLKEIDSALQLRFL